MNKSSFTSISGMAMLAIAPLLTTTANAQTPAATPNQTPNGLSGSYLGVAVDANQSLGLGQNYLQQSGSPSSWFINQALVNSQFSSTTNNKSSNTDLPVDGRSLQGRIDLQNSPISIRGKVSVGSNTSIVQPMISYDLPIAPNANIYAGAGYNFVTTKDNKMPQGIQNSVVVTAGAEAAVSDKVIVYSDAQYRLNNSNFKVTTPVNIQVGIGYRF